MATIAKKELSALINKGYQASKDLELSTRSIIEGYSGKPFLAMTMVDLGEVGINNPILKGYVTDCMNYGYWRTKRQLDSTKKSEEAAGWKNVKEKAESILKEENNNKVALELLKAAVMYNRISTMLSTRRAEYKKAMTPVIAPAPATEELIVEGSKAVKDIRQDILTEIASKLATSREGFTVVAYEKLVSDIQKMVAKVAKATKATESDAVKADKKEKAAKAAKAAKVEEATEEVTA